MQGEHILKGSNYQENLQHHDNITISADVYPFLVAMSSQENIRVTALKEEGKLQMFSRKSNEGWTHTLFIVDARALDLVAAPWIATVLHTVAYTIFQELVYNIEQQELRETWRDFFGYVLNATLAFLLVFRLNRAAGRYWTARELWGKIIARVRSLCGRILLHGGHKSREREEALRWLASLPLVIKVHIRGEQALNTKTTFSGILSESDLARVDANNNKALFVAEEVRNRLHQVFAFDDSMSLQRSLVLNQQYNNTAALLDDIMEAAGGLERIKSTPLPMVYVSHLRTFLLLNINLFPYIWGPSWGWATIGVVAVAAFALLGIEASGTYEHRLTSEKKTSRVLKTSQRLSCSRRS